MSKLGPSPSAVDALRELTSAYHPQLETLVAEILNRIEKSTPEFFYNDDIATDMKTAVRANVFRLARLLTNRPDFIDIKLPIETTDLTDGTIHHGIPLISLLEAWRTAQVVALDWWQTRLNMNTSARLLPAASKALNSLLSSYIDAGSEQIRASHVRQSERLQNSIEAKRHNIVKRILAGDIINTDTVSRSLDHPLSGRHIAVVLWFGEEFDDSSALQETVEALARVVAARHTIRTPITRRRIVVWLSSLDHLRPHLLGQYPLPVGIYAAASDEQIGLRGFVQAYHDAMRAAASARAAQPTKKNLVATFEYHELVILLSKNSHDRNRFVHRTLGALAVSDSKLDMLRNTLRIYLETGSSHTRTAELLGLHRNTIAYRLRSITELLPTSCPSLTNSLARTGQLLNLSVALHIIDVVGLDLPWSDGMVSP